MVAVTIIIFCAIIALILPVMLYDLYKKKQTLRMLAEKYGKPSTRTYDERDFVNIGQLFNLYPIEGKETVDDVTWNDIQMSILYKHMNHSVSHIGDEYLYRHIRTQQYDGLERLERHIQYFDTQLAERLKLQYAFNNINPRAKSGQTEKQATENRFVAHLKDHEVIPKISIITSLIIMFMGIISPFFMVYFIINDEVMAISLPIVLACTCIFVLGGTLATGLLVQRIQEFIPTIRTFSKCIKASRQLAKLDSHIFDKELKALLPALKKLNGEPVLMDLFLDVCLMENPSTAMYGQPPITHFFYRPNRQNWRKFFEGYGF